MDNGFVRRRPCGAETGEFGVDTVALEHIGGRYRLAAFLVGNRALDDRPVDAPGEIVLGRVDDILKAAIDNRFERVEPRLRSLPRRIAASPRPSIVTAGWALAACTAVRGRPVVTRRSPIRRRFIAVTAIARPSVLRASVRPGSVLRRPGPAAAYRSTIGDTVGLGSTRSQGARRPLAASPATRLCGRQLLLGLTIARRRDDWRRLRSLGWSNCCGLRGARRARGAATTTAAPA